MSIRAVIDTNVLVSSILSGNKNTPPVKIAKAIWNKTIVPVIHDDIISEYNDVLYREKFAFDKNKVAALLGKIIKEGTYVEPMPSEDALPDEKDRIFYESALAANVSYTAYLVTGNTKHFPARPFIVSPAQMVLMI